MASANMIKACSYHARPIPDLPPGAYPSTCPPKPSTKVRTYSLQTLVSSTSSKTDEEKRAGLHIEEIVARLQEGKKVHPKKVARCLRLLSTKHWWIEPEPGVFSPLS